MLGPDANLWDTAYCLPVVLYIIILCVHVYVHVHVLCMTLFHVLMLTVGHDNTPKCMSMLCMTVSHSDTYSGS